MENINKLISNYDEWDLYNSFFLCNDIERLRKFLVKVELFKKVLNIPGDIVELGVFKGTGNAQLLKLKEIFIPASQKKLVGFDLFASNYDLRKHKNLTELYEISNIKNKVKKEVIENYLNKLPLTNYLKNKKTLFEKKNFRLIEGDVLQTIPKYLKDNPGFRISLLYMDMDIYKPTLFSLEILYDRIVRGGIIILDEYACDKWTESNAVDEFLKTHKNLKIHTLEWSRTPTAFIIKE